MKRSRYFREWCTARVREKNESHTPAALNEEQGTKVTMVLTVEVIEGISAHISENIDVAIEEQLRIRELLILEPKVTTDAIRTIAGVDAAYSDREVIAAAVNLSYPEGAIISESVIREPALVPYLPGLFALREGRAVLNALRRLSSAPDMIMVHGHGYAHPRRCGLASHVGIILDRPTMGVADRLLVGEISTLPPFRGSMVPVIDRDEVIGMAIRTKENIRPVYVSIGHRTNLDQVVDLTLATTGEHRLPTPLWLADQRARQARTIRGKK